ncbi:MAG: carboxypeptidase-like regulatory domain-containing protein, partial [Acidobacteriaceae bacterium]|nr:carboxypeptidase-like regulatory domain-containing protein [Acidobacteriaceae bacterium]
MSWLKVCLRTGVLLLIAHAAAYAAEYHGRVFFNGFPVPGVGITAIRGEQKLTTVTDLQGLFEFSDLADGDWSIRVDMTGFVPQEQTLHLDKTTQAGRFDLKMLTLAEMMASVKAKPTVQQTLVAPPSPPVINKENKKKT